MSGEKVVMTHMKEVSHLSAEAGVTRRVAFGLRKINFSNFLFSRSRFILSVLKGCIIVGCAS